MFLKYFISSKSIKKEIMRKSIHLSSLWIPAFIYFFPANISFYLFSALALLNLVIEYGNYKKWAWARATYGRLFSKLLRGKEVNKDKFVISGSIYVLVAAALCSVIFAKEISAISITVMLISDTCSAIFGKIYGTRKVIKGKSMEGTIAFFVSALIIMLLFTPLFPVTYKSIIACFLATFVEVFEDKIKIDDNLSIPLVVGLVLTFL